MVNPEKDRMLQPGQQPISKKKKLSDDAADGIAAIFIIAFVVSVVVYWLETMT